MSIPEYEMWKKQPTPETMANVIDALEPTINIEIQKYNGPKPLLKSKAKELTIEAIQKYDPSQGVNLRSWVSTQLKSLARYSNKLKPVYVPEDTMRQAAELNKIKTDLAAELDRDPTFEELADKSGLSVKKIKSIFNRVSAVVPESTFIPTQGEEDEAVSLPATSTSNTIDTTEELVYSTLPERDQMIVNFKTGRRGAPVLSNQEIAKRLGVSPAYVTQRSKQIAEQIINLSQKGV